MITASPDGLVGQDELTQGRIPARVVRSDGRFCQTGRHRVRIGKKGGLAESCVPRPEPDTDLLGIAANPPDQAGIWWRLDRTTGIAREGQVEGPPPERHGRDPAAEPGPMLFEHEVDPS